MSRQLAFSVVGGVIGYALTGTPVGFQYGAAAGAVGAALTAKDINTEDPRPDETKLPGASEGDPIPYVEGTARVAGVVAWASAKRVISTTTSQGGKGPDQNVTTYSEEIDVLILLTCNQMEAVRRIWAYGKLEWSIADDADAQTLADSQTTGLWRAIRFYTGAPGQLPDPTYEAAVGVGNAPAYRGRSYVVIEGLQLQSGSQLPVLNFEVCSAATLSFVMASRWTVYSGLSSRFPGSISFSGDDEPLYYNAAGGSPSQGDLRPSNTTGIVEPLAVAIDYSGIDNNGNQGDEHWGWSDVPVLMTVGSAPPASPSTTVGYYQDTGQVLYSFSPNQGVNRMRYVVRGERAYFAPSAPGSQRVFRFAKVGGSIAASSDEFDDYVTELAANDDLVFAYDNVSAQVHMLDALTLVEEGTPFSLPGSGTRKIFCSDTGDLYCLSSTNLYVRDLDAETWTAQPLSGSIPDLSLVRHSPVYAGSTLHLMTSSDDGDDTLTTAYSAFTTAAGLSVPLSDVMDRLAARTGQLQPADYDHSALTGIDVRGMVVNRSTSTRAVMEMLQRGYLFEQVEGDTIKAVLRGGSTVATLPYDDLGTSEGESPAEPLPIRRLNDIEQAARVTVKYLNAENDFQTGAATGDRLITDSTAEQTLELALAFTPQEAKRLADVYTMDIAVGLTTLGPVAFGRKYRRLEPSDPIGLTNSDGSVYRARILKITDSGDVRVAELVADDATTINSLALTDSNYTPQTLVRGAAPTEAVYGDWPLLRDADDTPGWYVAMTATGRWAGGRLMRSLDDVQFDEVVQVTDRAVLGQATTALEDWTGGNVFDEAGSVTVNVGDGELSSSTRTAMLADRTVNVAAIGAHGRWEFIRFRTATLLGAGIYRLSGLLRGRRGTEWATGTHTDSDSFVLLQAPGLRRVTTTQADIGLQRYYRAVSIGRQLDSANSATFTDTGEALRPFSPRDLGAQRNVSGDITFTWRRRTRLSARFLTPGIELPLGEATEAYVVEIYDDDTYTTLLRTLDPVTDSQATYSAADQVTDFGSTQSNVAVRIYQISASVGRGHALQDAA